MIEHMIRETARIGTISYINRLKASVYCACVQPTQSSCGERAILEGRYRADLRVYIEAVERMKEAEPHPFGEFQKLGESAERARLVWKRAHEALNAHLSEHKCA